MLRAMQEVPKDAVTEEKRTQASVHEELRGFLECPICFEEFGDSWVMACRNDHWMCSTCYPKLKACPECREEIKGAASRRCRQLEKVLKLVSALQLPEEDN